MPCVVRLGRYGVVATLSEAQIGAAVSSGDHAPFDAFFGLATADATSDALAGPGFVHISGLPANPGRALAPYFKEVLGLGATPDVTVLSDAAFLRPRSAQDTCARQTPDEPFAFTSIFPLINLFCSAALGIWAWVRAVRRAERCRPASRSSARRCRSSGSTEPSCSPAGKK